MRKKDIIVYLGNPKESTKKNKKQPPRTNEQVQQGCRTQDKYTKKSIVFLYTSNAHMDT